jgi:hypothetical protein
MPNAVTSHVEHAAATIVARPVGQLDASGEAALVTLQEVTVSVAYDDLYLQELSAADSTKLANAFAVSGNGATFTASISSAADFEDVLARNMATAICTEYNSKKDISGSDASVGLGLNLKQTIYNGMLNQFKRVFTDSLPNLLESDWALSNTVGYAPAAADMQTKLTAQECEIIAQQLPESNYVLYMDASSEDAVTSALPLKDGDSIIFVFQVSESAVARVNTKTPGANPDTGASAAANASNGNSPYGAAQQAVTYISNTRTVAFQFKVKSDAHNGGKLDSLKA